MLHSGAALMRVHHEPLNPRILRVCSFVDAEYDPRDRIPRDHPRSWRSTAAHWHQWAPELDRVYHGLRAPVLWQSSMGKCTLCWEAPGLLEVQCDPGTWRWALIRNGRLTCVVMEEPYQVPAAFHSRMTGVRAPWSFW